MVAVVCKAIPLFLSFFFFFRLASNVFPDIWLVGRIEKKKPINNHKKSRNRRPGTPGCGCGAWKQQDMNPENQYGRKVG